MQIQFCGAVSSVTGSNHLITSGEHKILLDCGQFQGGKAQDALNYEEFPYNPADIECMILSHAHVDHCGRIPLLVKRGFKGPIYCTDATADLVEIMLKDSGYIHEKEAQWKNQKLERQGKPLVEPLYTFNDAVASLQYLHPIRYDQLIDINEDMKICFNDAGHILGSSIVELWITEGEKTCKVVFSGDLGMPDRPILKDPTIIKKADVVIMESTYGNRVHPPHTTGVDDLLKIVAETVERKGTVVIPAFAVGRTQELIYELNRYYEDVNNPYHDMLEHLDVYVDSPMATTATEVFRKNAQVFDEETKEYILRGDDPLDFKNLKFTRSSDDSKALNADKTPKIIISASGMCEAGRIRHHLKHNLWNKDASIIFVGYQAEGTLGRTLLDGIEEVTLFGEPVRVNAHIYNLQGFSGHADQNGLLHWLAGFEEKPKQVFLVHGEQESKEDFAALVHEKLGMNPVVIEGVSTFDLESAEVLAQGRDGVIKSDAVPGKDSGAKAAAGAESGATGADSANASAKDGAAAPPPASTANAQGYRVVPGAPDAKAVEALRRRMADVHSDLEKVLFNSSQMVDTHVDPEKLIAIQNLVADLEKSTMQLGAEVAGKDSVESAE